MTSEIFDNIPAKNAPTNNRVSSSFSAYIFVFVSLSFEDLSNYSWFLTTDGIGTVL